jgi:CheY-like chemotaxis protein
VAGEQIRLLVVEDVPQVASHMRALLNAQSQIKVLDVVTSGEKALSAVGELKPDIVIVDALLQGRVSGNQVAESIRHADPNVATIMLTVPQNPVMENPERGIDAVLKMPFTGFDLTTLIRKTSEDHAVESARVGCQVLAFFSPKGGVGRTTLAYNLAVALASEHRVCLIDGSLQFSDMRGLLRIPAGAPSILNLPTDQIRESDMSEVLWKDPSGVHILLAPPRVEMAEMVTVRDIEKALSILRRLSEYVIVDTRRASWRPSSIGLMPPAASARPMSRRRSVTGSTSRWSRTGAWCSRRITRAFRSWLPVRTRPFRRPSDASRERSSSGSENERPSSRGDPDRSGGPRRSPTDWRLRLRRRRPNRPRRAAPPPPR